MDPFGLVLKREHVEQWAAEHAPGERLLSHLCASQYSPRNVGRTAQGSSLNADLDLGDRGRVAFVESLGLDPEKKVQSPKQSTVYALTDRHLLVGTRGGFRDRPKELLHAGPGEGLVVHWYDGRPEAGNQFRHFVVVFADGTWRSDRTGIKVLGRVPKAGNADHFLEALGDRAVEVT